MPDFTDRHGHRWTITFNVGLVRHIKQRLDVDLLAVDGALFARLLGDPITLVDVLWLTVEEQAQQQDIDDRQFGYSLDADTIEGAVEALMQGLIDFFPRPRRQAMRTLWERSKLAVEKAGQMANEKVSAERIDQVLEQSLLNTGNAMDKLIEDTLRRATTGTPCGGSPGSPGSTRSP